MNEQPNTLTAAQKAYDDFMGWKGITYIVVGMYVFLAAINIYKQVKK